jgi:hypothetical protein
VETSLGPEISFEKMSNAGEEFPCSHPAFGLPSYLGERMQPT